MKINNFLFKAKHIDNKEWEIGSLIVLPNGDCEIGNKCKNPPDGDPMWKNVLITHKIDKTTVCRYTGLTDKNGRKIWEHDIVDFFGQKGEVKYECGCFGIAYSDVIDWEEIAENIFPITGCENRLNACKNDNFISLWEIMSNYNDEEDSIGTVEVIGNSFDNPELLEETQNNKTPRIFQKVINAQPTAYDVEKVVEELEELEVKSVTRYKGGNFGDYDGVDYYIKKSEALEIVKQCGVSDDVCELKSDYGFISDKYKRETQCGYTFYDLHHAVAFKYCPYCGKKMKVVK